MTLDNPKRHNALSNQTFRFDLPELLSQLGKHNDVRVIVITGAGRAFCAGTELDADGFGDASYDDTLALLRRMNLSVAACRKDSSMDGVLFMVNAMSPRRTPNEDGPEVVRTRRP